MGGSERQQRIIAGLAAGMMSAEALAQRLNVSTSTVRRELARLEQLGQVRRTYGGAVLAPHVLEPTRTAKGHEALAEKNAIAARAARLVTEGDTVLIGAGSTAGRLAWQLRARSDLTVVTNGVETITILSGAENIRLVAIGGTVRSTSQAILGAVAEEQLRRLTFDVAFIGADGIDSVDGISCPAPEVASIKERKMARSRRVVVIADHRKLGARPFDYWAPTEREYLLITDTGATAEQMEPFAVAPLATLDAVEPLHLSASAP